MRRPEASDVTNLRLPENPDGEPRGPEVTIKVDGRSIRAFEGESLGAAMHAAGITVLSRSIKYHRPRGLFCMVGKCANCLMRVDGEPNVRTCVVPVSDGMKVESQNAFPSARRDVMGVIDKVYPKQFDHHDKFIRPRFMTPVYHGVIRRMAGWGKVTGVKEAPPLPPIRKRTVDAVVAGGGPAGLAAAKAFLAERPGSRLILCEERERVGGELLRNRRGTGLDEPGLELAKRLAADVGAAGGDVIAPGSLIGLYPEGEAVILTPDGLIEARPRVVILATGVYEQPLLFAGNDLPGIMGARAASMMVHHDGVLPGRRAVIAGATAVGAAIAEALVIAGCEVLAVVGPRDGGAFPEGIPADLDARITAARGGSGLESVTITRGDGTTETIPCDTVILAAGEAPRPELMQQAGVAMTWNPDLAAYVPDADEDGGTNVPHVFVCGDAVRPAGPSENMASGERTGRFAARALESIPTVNEVDA